MSEFFKFYRQEDFLKSLMYLVFSLAIFLFGSSNTIGYLREARVLDLSYQLPWSYYIVTTICFLIGGFIGTIVGSYIKFKKN